MKQDGTLKSSLERLEAVLDIYGSSQNRWPEAEQLSLQALVAGNKTASSMAAEAGALARVMEAAPSAPVNAALCENIIAAAMEEQKSDATVVPLPLNRRRVSQITPLRRSNSIWPAAALAASFAFGLYMGAIGVGETAFEDVLQIALSNNSAIDAGGSWLEDSAASDEAGLL